MPVLQIDTVQWTGRCASRIAEVDKAIGGADAARIARNMGKVERLSAMAPRSREQMNMVGHDNEGL